jgi:hypothetical protein
VHGHSPAEYVFGKQLSLPSDYFPPEETVPNPDIPRFLESLFSKMRSFSPPSREHKGPTYVPSFASSHVWLRKPSHNSLERPYSGPFRVISQDEKTITLLIDDGQVKVSKDRVKPAFQLEAMNTVSAVSSLRSCMKRPGTQPRNRWKKVRFFNRSTLMEGGL